MKHLHRNTVKLLKLADHERMQVILNFKWISYTRAENILNKMNILMKCPSTHPIAHLLIVSETNNGRTAILDIFSNENGPYAEEKDGTLVWPVLYVQAPPEPSEKRFYNIILDRVFTLYKISDNINKKQQQVIHTLKIIKLKILIIDEIQHILAGTLTKQLHFLNILKHLADELMISLVCSGIQTPFTGIQKDEQFANRFELLVLPKWRIGGDYFRLLAEFEYLLPLRNSSNLINEAIALKVLSMSEGSIGEIFNVLKKAAILAIKTKSERITIPILEKIDYISPSQRMKYFNPTI